MMINWLGFLLGMFVAKSRNVPTGQAVTDGLLASMVRPPALGAALVAGLSSNQAAAAASAAPAAPVLTAVPTTVDGGGENVVVLTWTATPGASVVYNVRRSPSDDPTSPLNNKPLTTTMYIDDDGGDGLDAKTKYTYTIDAVNSQGTLIVSSTPLAVPIA